MEYLQSKERASKLLYIRMWVKTAVAILLFYLLIKHYIG